MLEKFQNAISPKSLVEVVPETVLRSQMQGFFFAFRAGALLIYDEGKDVDGKLILKRLEPVDDTDSSQEMTRRWRTRFENFNPFCAKFRENPKRDQLCEACDQRAAFRAIEEPASDSKKATRYSCHMGLLDVTYPIKISGRIRGVLFAGQKIAKDDEDQLERIHENVNIKAPELTDELIKTASIAAMPKQEIENFIKSFEKFGESMQATVDAFVSANREEQERESLLEISQLIANQMVSGDSNSNESMQCTINAVAELFGGQSIWLLQRRGSSYRCVAYTENLIKPNVSFPVASLISLPQDKLVKIALGTREHNALANKLEKKVDKIWAIRCDAPSRPHEHASLILLLTENLPTHLVEFAKGMLRILARSAGVNLLIERLAQQQEDFSKSTSFTGHHLKTPIQAALNLLYEAKRIVGVDHLARLEIEKAEEQVLLGLADTLRLQDAASSRQRTSIDIYKMLVRICEDLRPIARPRNISVRIGSRPSSLSCSVFGVEAQLRVAFTNLLDNAIKYAFENTWIDIRFSGIRTDQSPRTSDLLLVEIENVGVGFPPDRRDDLFSIGTRLVTSTGVRERLGSGIGLVQAKEYIENVGGSLDISSSLVPFSQSKHKVTVFVHLPNQP